MSEITKPELIWKYKGDSTLVSDMSDDEVINARKVIDKKVLYVKARLKTLERIQDALKEEISSRSEENELMEQIDKQIKQEVI